MTILAITGLPNTFSRKQLVSLLTPVVGGRFEVLKFDSKVRYTKTCYIRISETLDAQHITKNISGLRIGHYKLLSFIPSQDSSLLVGANIKKISEKIHEKLNVLPGYTLETLPVAANIPKISEKMHEKRNILPGYTPEVILRYTHEQILLEMQSIYTGLYALNNKTGDKLLEAIGQIVYDRLKVISVNQKIETCITLSRIYRKTHPHFADFQFILTALNKIYDKMGKSRQSLEEKELLTAGIKPYAITNISQEQIQGMSVKYSEKIIKAVVDHINQLSTDIDPQKSSIEEAARIEVREKLKSMVPHFPNIIRDVISKHLSPQQSTVYVVKIFGDPCLPSKAVMKMWAHSFGLFSVTNSDRLYNLLLARCPSSRHDALLAADGSLLGGSKLIIRPADTPYKRIPISIKHEEQQQPEEQRDEDAEMEWTGEW